MITTRIQVVPSLAEAGRRRPAKPGKWGEMVPVNDADLHHHFDGELPGQEFQPLLDPRLAIVVIASAGGVNSAEKGAADTAIDAMVNADCAWLPQPKRAIMTRRSKQAFARMPGKVVSGGRMAKRWPVLVGPFPMSFASRCSVHKVALCRQSVPRAGREVSILMASLSNPGATS